MKLLNKFINGANLVWVLLFTILFTGSHLTNLQSQLVSSGLILTLAFIYLCTQKSIRLEKFDFFALGFLLFFNLSFYFNQTPFGFKEFITFNGGFLLYFLVKNWTPTKFEKELHHIYFKWAIIAISILLLFNINNFLTSPLDRFAGFFFGDEAYSIYPNVLANFLLILIPVTYYLYQKENFQYDRASKLVYLFSLIVFLTSFWLTSSRTSLLGMCLILGLATGFLLVKFRSLASLFKNITGAVLMFLLTMVLALGVFNAKTYSIDYHSRVTPGKDISAQKSVDERIILFENAFQIGKDNLFFGVGPGSFQFINPSYQSSSLVNSEHPHNIFLKLFAENGLLATIFFVLWITCLLLASLKRISQSIRSSYFIVFATTTGLLFTAIFDYNLGFTIIFILFFILLGLLANYSLREVALDKVVLLNFQPAIKIILAVLIPLFIYQSYIFITLHQLESASVQSDQQLFLTKAHLVHSAPFAFKNDYLTVLNNSLLDNQNFKEIYLEATHKWPHYAPSYLYLENPAQYLELDFYNNFQAHLLKLQLTQPETDYLEKLKSLLRDYNYLLSINAHNTVATENPIFVYQIYEHLITQFPQDQILLAQFESFKNIYFDEMVKFDTRFSTTLLNNYYEWKTQNS